MLDLLRPDLPTLAESFLAQGYRTAGIFSWLAFDRPILACSAAFRPTAT